MTALVGLSCDGRGGKIGLGAGSSGGLEVELAIPLQPEQAGLVAGAREDSKKTGGEEGVRVLSTDIFVNDQPTAQGLSGGVRSDVKAGIRGVSTGAKSPERATTTSGSQTSGATSLVYHTRFTLSPEGLTGTTAEIRAEVRMSRRAEIGLLEIKAKPKLALAGGGVEVVGLEEASLSFQDVALPDEDGDGVASLVETAVKGADVAADKSATVTLDELKKRLPELETALRRELSSSGTQADPPKFGEVMLDPPTLTLAATTDGADLAAGSEVAAGKSIAFTFTCSVPSCTFQCSADGGSLSACQSPHEVVASTEGSHKLRVLAAGVLGNRTEQTFEFAAKGACPSSTELCDGKDNDCDGQVDEDFELGKVCAVGNGACERTSGRVCKADQSGWECGTKAGEPTTEVCGDKIDNDCNGKADDAPGC